MTLLVEPANLERFRAILARGFGLNFDDTKLPFLADLLGRRVEANGHVCGAYLSRLETPGGVGEELRALAQELTVAETYFFRNLAQFRAFAEVALPDRVRAQSARRRLRLLSAGCASGEEPYSLAILLREHGVEAPWETSILGIDVNPAMLQKAGRGRYSTWSLRETPVEIQERWFTAEGREFTLDGSIRAGVTFEERNLVDENADFWRLDSYDVVFCRNVIMYFTPEAARGVVARIARALVPGGYLFLGHAETLRGLSQDFHLRHTHGTFYYQRRDVRDRPWPRDPVATEARPSPTTSPLVVMEGAATWVEAIRRAAERIQTLAQAPSGRPPPPGPRPEAALDLGLARELLKEERFAEALDFVHALPAESAGDPDVLLLRAVLLTHGGQLEAAESVCRALLQVDELNTGAHYLLALCREGMGDRQGAIDHDQVAAYLDPGFAMPRLHLGLLARRIGDRDLARRELGQALILLQREDSSRLLLFGGGFKRDALVALCRAELLTCGGTA